jgi:hypothetical protein
MKKDLITIIAKCLLQDSLSSDQIELIQGLSETDLILDYDLDCDEARAVLTHVKRELNRNKAQKLVMVNDTPVNESKKHKANLIENTVIAAYEKGKFVLRCGGTSKQQKYFLYTNNHYREVNEQIARRLYEKAKNKILPNNKLF